MDQGSGVQEQGGLMEPHSVLKRPLIRVQIQVTEWIRVQEQRGIHLESCHGKGELIRVRGLGGGQELC